MNSLHKTLWTLAALLIVGLFACFSHQLTGPAPTTKMLAMVLLLGFAGIGLMGAYMFYALTDHIKRQLEPKVGGGSGCTSFDALLKMSAAADAATASPGNVATVASNKVTSADIEAAIAHEIYFSGDNGFAGAQGGVFESYCIVRQDELAPQQTLQLMTFCVLILKNGFKVVGTSACVDPANYQAEDGRKYARENAIDQLWPVLGYELCDKLAKQRT